MTAVSQWEREAIGERTRDALNHKRTRRERVGNVAFGYRVGKDGVHVQPDNAEQAVISFVRERRECGRTLRAIANELNARGLLTRRGTPWRHKHVARIEAALAKCAVSSR